MGISQQASFKDKTIPTDPDPDPDPDQDQDAWLAARCQGAPRGWGDSALRTMVMVETAEQCARPPCDPESEKAWRAASVQGLPSSEPAP